MTTAVSRRRGTTADNNRFTGIEGEITVDLGNAELRVHTGDGTVGGYGTARKDLQNVDQSTIASRGIAKNDLSNVDNINVLNKAAAAAATNAGGGIAYKNLSNTSLSDFGDFSGDDDTNTGAGGLAYKDLSNVTGTAFFNNLGIARRDMTNVTDEVILNKAVARATTLGGTGLAYSNFKNTKISNLGTFIGTDDSGTSAGGLAYKDLSNVTSVNRLVTLGLAKADLTNVTAAAVLAKAASGASDAGGAGLTYVNLSNTSLTSYGTFSGTDDTQSHAGGLAYKDLSNTKLSKYGNFTGEDDTSTSAAGLAYKDLSNVTGTQFFTTLGIAKSDMSNVADATLLSKINTQVASNGGEEVAYKNLKNTKLSAYGNFAGTDDSTSLAGGLAYKDLSNTKLSSFSNFIGNDDVNKTGLAYRDLSNTTIQSQYLDNYALKSGSDIDIDQLASRGLAYKDMSNIDPDLLHKQHLNLLLNSTGAANFNGYSAGTNVGSSDTMAYDLWYSIDEGNSSITNYSMSRNKTDQSLTISGSFVQELNGVKSLIRGKKVYVWCSSLSSVSGLSCNFLSGKDISSKYFSTNKTFTASTVNGKSIYYAVFDFSESTAASLLNNSQYEVTFFISSTSSHTIQHLQIEIGEITTYESKRDEQEASEALSLSSKMNQIITLISMSTKEPDNPGRGDCYYNTTSKKIFRYEEVYGATQWIDKGQPVYNVLYVYAERHTAYFWDGSDLAASEGAVNWGSVVGTLTNQQDLVDYIAGIDATNVHLSGNESISGTKTFSGTIIGVKPSASNSTTSTTVPTIGWINDPATATNVVHRSGDESIGGNKTITGITTLTGPFRVNNSNGGIELIPNTSTTNGGLIDFHYAGSTDDYTARIIEDKSGQLTYTGSERFTATNSTTSGVIATKGWVNSASAATNLVHRSDAETITGIKTFSAIPIGTKPAASNSTTDTQIPTIGWINDPATSTNVVHRTGNENITGIKTLASNSDLVLITKSHVIDSDINPPSTQFSNFIDGYDVNGKLISRVYTVKNTNGTNGIAIQAWNGSTNYGIAVDSGGNTAAPTPSSPTDSSNKIATTSWVNARITARLPQITYW